jgi:hypothetical protein
MNINSQEYLLIYRRHYAFISAILPGTPVKASLSPEKKALMTPPHPNPYVMLILLQTWRT